MGRPARHTLHRSQRVEVSVDRAFEFFGDALNLEAITPPWLAFRVLTAKPIAMGAGTLIDYRLRLHGVPVRWQTRIAVWDPPHRFVDVQLHGPYRLWQHTHTFEPIGDAATQIVDQVDYALPLGPIGSIAHRLFVRRDLRRIFDHRAQVISRLLRE